MRAHSANFHAARRHTGWMTNPLLAAPVKRVLGWPRTRISTSLDGENTRCQTVRTLSRSTSCLAAQEGANWCARGSDAHKRISARASAAQRAKKGVT